MFPRLLDPENQQNFVWADSADSGARLQNLLELAGFDNLINAKGSHNHPLSEEQTLTTASSDRSGPELNMCSGVSQCL